MVPTSLATRMNVLRRVPYFAGLPEHSLRAIARSVIERHYRSGQVVAPRGHVVDGLLVVLSGRVTVTVAASRGRRQVLLAAGPGRTVGDFGAFAELPCPGELQAAVSSSIGVIPRRTLKQVLTEHPQATLAMLQFVGTRARVWAKMVEAFAFSPVTTRIADLLLALESGEPSVAELDGNHSYALTQNDIAAMVGSVRAVAQRALKALERAGAVRLSRGHVQIVDPSILKRWNAKGRARADRTRD